MMYTENFETMKFSEHIKIIYPNSIYNDGTFLLYSSFDEEKNTIKNGVGLRITENPTFIRLNGKDTIDFLQRISTNDLKTLKENSKINTHFLNEKGRFISRTTLINYDDNFYLLSESDTDNKLYNWINKYIIMEDIKTENFASKFSLLEFIGPQTNSFLTIIIGDEINKITLEEFRRFDVDGFTFFMFLTKENEQTIFKILIEKNRLVDFYKYLDSIKSVFDLKLIGEYAYDYFRVQNVIPKFPNEINAETNPHEINLIHEVNFKKGCYIGQEVIARLDTYDKVQRKLVKAKFLNQNYKINDIILSDEENSIIGKITTSNLELFPEILCLVKKSMLNGKPELPIKIGNQILEIKIFY